MRVQSFVNVLVVVIVLGMLLPTFSAAAVSSSGWGTAQLIETDNSGNAQRSQVAVDGAGNAVAVWDQSDGIRTNIWSNRYVVGAGWGTVQLIETGNSGDARDPQVAVDGAGNAVAVWSQSDGTRYNAWSNRYVVGTGWGTAQLIQTANSALNSSSNLQVAVEGAGNAVAVWNQWDSTPPGGSNIWSNRYVVGTGWGTAQLIETDNSGLAYFPHVAVDDAGNAIAVWRQSDGTRYNAWSNRYVVGTGWGTAQLIETDNSGDAYDLQVAVDGAGDAVAVWYQPYGSQERIWSNRYVVGGGWGTAQLIDTDISKGSYVPQVAVDDAGNAIAVWYQYDSSARVNIWSNRYVKPDTTPPSLALSSPSEGMTIETPVITVSGTTEPGAVLKISGTVVAVGPDGSFSCKIALTEGANAIMATATDAAGNSVTLSRNVTYDNLLPELKDELNTTREDLNTTREDLSGTNADLKDVKSQSLILMAVLVIFAVMAIVMSLMCLSLRKKISDMSGASVERVPPPPQG